MSLTENNDVYLKYHLKKVINASGRMTILGVSTPRPEVVDTVAHGLNEYFEIKDLIDKTGEYIARLLNVENAVVVSCASAGIVQAVAAFIVKDDADLLYNLHSSDTKTDVYSFLNISKIGLIRQNELSDINDIDIELFDKALANYPHFIIGIKVRMSRSVVGANGIYPLQKAKQMQKKSGLPLMVHIGNNPPDLDEIANLLTKRDIITHCFC